MIQFKIKNIKPVSWNPRIMPDSEMQSLMKSIEIHGFIDAIVLNGNKERYGSLIGGHQRLIAVEKLLAQGVEIKNIEKDSDGDWTIPAMLVDLSEEHEKQANIALNKIHGKFDEEKLYDLIFEMKESPTLPTTGFREDEVSRILDRGMEDEDEEEKLVLTTEPRSKLGEVYELGPHRLICGDSTDPETYTKLFGSINPDMIWTDPPYNVALKSRGKELKEEGKESIMNDDMSMDDFRKFIEKIFKNIESVLKPGGCYYICSGYGSYPIFYYELAKTKLHLSSVIMWVKTGGQMAGWQEYHRRHEQIIVGKKGDGKNAVALLYGWHNGQTHSFYGDFEYDVWEMPRKSISKYLHPTEKPDWLPMRAIRNSTKRGDIVLDPFSGSGSGSVMSACEKTGRRAFMIEMDPKFCDVIRNRWDRIIKAKNKAND